MEDVHHPAPNMHATLLKVLFTTEHLSPEWFAPPLLAQVPLPQLEHIVAGLKAAFGSYEGLEQAAGDSLVVLERALIPTHIALDSAGRIASLFFQPPRPRLAVSSFDALLRQYAALPGEVGLLVLRDSTPLAVLNSNAPLAVASGFKLAVLAALRRQVDQGARSWSDVIALDSSWKSHPSGILHSWPAGSPLTLHTLASLMISQSDNTAADALIHALGRAPIEALSPHSRPFLTTRELFCLKGPQGARLRARFSAGSPLERHALLASPEMRALPLPQSPPAEPTALDIEWFFSASELCALVSDVADLPILGINPGPIDPKGWSRVGFKGGSEPGVLSLTASVHGATSHAFHLAAIWNHSAPLDEARFVALFLAALELLPTPG